MDKLKKPIYIKNLYKKYMDQCSNKSHVPKHCLLIKVNFSILTSANTFDK